MNRRGVSETLGIPRVQPLEQTIKERAYFEALRVARAQSRNKRAVVLAQYENTECLFRCGKCGSDKHVSLDERVVRAADEGSVYDCKCNNCGFQFRV